MKAWKKSVVGAATAGTLLMGVGAVPAQAAQAVSASNGNSSAGGRPYPAPTRWIATSRAENRRKHQRDPKQGWAHQQQRNPTGV